MNHSRILTRVLRHQAENYGLSIRKDGFVKVNDILALDLFKKCSVDEINEIVKLDKKGRFSTCVIDSELFIRANQGHSLNTVESEQLMTPLTRGEESLCVHGTSLANWNIIKTKGLSKMGRNAIHCAKSDFTGEVKSGFRINSEVLIYLNLDLLFDDGIPIFKSANDVLCIEKDVSPKYFQKVLNVKTKESLI